MQYNLSDKPYVLIGSGGHAKVLIDLLKTNHLNILGCIDPHRSKGDVVYSDVQILGDDQYALSYDPKDVYLVNAIGTRPSKDNSGTAVRKKIYLSYKDKGFTFPPLIHKEAIISESLSIGSATQIMAGAIVQADSKIGENVIINTASVVEHDCHIGHHSHIAPSSTLCGGVKIGIENFIGARSVFFPLVSTHDYSIIRAGSIITKSH